MNKKTLLILGATGGLAYLAYKQWNIRESVKLFQYYPAGIKFDVEGLSLSITVSIDVFNPNRTSVPITGVVGRLIFKGAPIGVFNNTQPITINGLDKHRVEIKVRVSAIGVIQAITTKDPSLTLAIDGLVKTPLTDVKLNVSQKLSSLVSGTGIGRLSKLNSDLAIKNLITRLRSRRPAAHNTAVVTPFRNDQVGFLSAFLFNKLRKKKKQKKAAQAAAAVTPSAASIIPAAQVLPEGVQAPMATPMDWRNFRLFGPGSED